MCLCMLKLSVGNGHQVMKQLCLKVLQYYATVATELAGYVLYRALVVAANDYIITLINSDSLETETLQNSLSTHVLTAILS